MDDKTAETQRVTAVELVRQADERGRMNVLLRRCQVDEVRGVRDHGQRPGRMLLAEGRDVSLDQWFGPPLVRALHEDLQALALHGGSAFERLDRTTRRRHMCSKKTHAGESSTSRP